MTKFFKTILRKFKERMLQIRLRSCSTGYLLLDFLLFIGIYFVEQTILPRLFEVNVPLALIWLTLYIIQASAYQSFFLCLLYGNLNDLTGTVPYGFYTVSSFLIWTILLALRDSLSWNYLLPWVASLILAQVGNFLFLVIVMVERDLSSALDFYFFLEKFFTITLAVLLGTLITWPEVKKRRQGTQIVVKTNTKFYRWADE